MPLPPQPSRLDVLPSLGIHTFPILHGAMWSPRRLPTPSRRGKHRTEKNAAAEAMAS